MFKVTAIQISYQNSVFVAETCLHESIISAKQTALGIE